MSSIFSPGLPVRLLLQMSRALTQIGCVSLLAAGVLRAAPVEITPAEMAGALQPQVAVSPAGVIHVTFGSGSAVYHAASSDGGRTFSQCTKVAELPKLALGMRRGPRIVATDKVLAITAISHSEGALHGWTSADGGTTWKATARINDVEKSAREGLHAMAADGHGRAFVTWLDLRNKGMELWSATSSDGGSTWSANSRVYRSPDGHICECCHPSAAIDSRGRIAVMWRNWLNGARDMYAAVSPDAGKTFGAAEKLGTGTWKLNGCPMDGGAIAFASDGTPISAWRRERTVFTSGMAGPEQRLADSAVQPLVLATKRGPYFFWESAGSLMLKRGAAAPAKLAEEAAFAAGASLPDGRCIVAWQSEATGTTRLLAEVLD